MNSFFFAFSEQMHEKDKERRGSMQTATRRRECYVVQCGTHAGPPKLIVKRLFETRTMTVHR